KAAMTSLPPPLGEGGGGGTRANAPTPTLPQRGREKNFLAHAKYVLSDNPFTLGAAVLFALFVLLAIVGPWIAPFDPLATNVGPAMSPPSARNWFGTDSLGRDIFS